MKMRIYFARQFLPIRPKPLLVMCLTLLLMLKIASVFFGQSSTLSPNRTVLPKSVYKQSKREEYAEFRDKYCQGLAPPFVPVNAYQKSGVTKHKFVNIFRASEENTTERSSIDQNKCVPYKTTLGMTPIFIYDPKIDIHISRLLVERGVWEEDDVGTVASFLKENPDMLLLDVGCNIGVFTLQAAKMGHTVISIDANKFNLRLLSKSLNLGGLESFVTLIWNAVSDVHEAVTLTITTGNIGGSFVKLKGDVDTKMNSTYTTQTAFAIQLDDLIGMVKENDVFMKIDTEGSELKAFKGGRSFFKEINVKYVLMEWMHFANTTNAPEIIDFMTDYRYQPYQVNRTLDHALIVDNYHTWPTNILWVKK